MSTFQCEELGQVTLIDPKDRKKEQHTLSQHILCEYAIDEKTLEQIRGMARTMIDTIDSVDRSTRKIDSKHTASLVIIFKEGVNRQDATDASIVLIKRITRNLDLQASHARGNVAMAINSSVRRFEE